MIASLFQRLVPTTSRTNATAILRAAYDAKRRPRGAVDALGARGVAAGAATPAIGWMCRRRGQEHRRPGDVWHLPAGICIPDWQSIVQLAMAASRAAKLGYLGIDIVLARGPLADYGLGTELSADPSTSVWSTSFTTPATR